MYCHLCRTEVSEMHDRSTGHRAAQELAAVALDRLINHIAASGDSEGSINVSADAEKSSVKTPKAVSFCDTCNAVYPINEQSSHYRQKKHALAFLSEQEFEELVHAYIGREPKETTSEPSDDVALVDETEAVNKYTCQLCVLEVPRVFKIEHERGSWHRASRMLALAASRRARDMLATTDRFGDGSGDKPKFSGKMMKKLLKAYTLKSDEVENTEERKATIESDPESTKPGPELTPKEYFTDILPFLPYVGTFNILYIDNTEFVTIKIENDALKIHVNNLNALYNMDGNDGYYMSCKLCDGSSNTYYSSIGQQHKLHIMSLGHIRNVMSPVDNVHLIRKINDTHYLCGLCNVLLYSHILANAVENHIFKDSRHSAALTEALERGKDFKETKDCLKIMIYTPSVPKPSIFKGNNQNLWPFGTPQQPKQYTGLFRTQNAGFGTAQNTGFGYQNQNTFGSRQNTFGGASTNNVGFGSTQSTGFGNTQNTGFGSAQTSAFGSSVQSKVSIFGSTPNHNNTGPISNAPNNVTGFGASSSSTSGFGASPSNATGFVAAQNNTTGFIAGPTKGLGAIQNNVTGFGVSQNVTSLYGNHSNASVFGASPNNATGFGVSQNVPSLYGNHSNASVFGASPNNATGFGVSQNVPSLYGNHSNASVFGASPNNATGFGAAQNNATNTGAGPTKATGLDATQNNATAFGVSQNVTSVYGNQNNATGFGASPSNNTSAVGVLPNNGTGFGVAQNKAADFVATYNTAASGAVQKTGFIFANTQKDNIERNTSSAPKQNEDKNFNIQSNNTIFKEAQSLSPSDFKLKDEKPKKATEDPQNKQSSNVQIQTKNDGNGKIQREKEPPKRLNYSSSSSDSD